MANSITVTPLENLCSECAGLGYTVERDSGRDQPCTAGCARGVIPAECDTCRADITDSCDASCDDTVNGCAIRSERDGGDVLEERCCEKCLLPALVECVLWIGTDARIAWSGVAQVVVDAADAVARAREATTNADMKLGLAIGDAIGKAVYGGRS